jgi:calcineurin-like phosphoesterase family protein
MLAVAIGIVLAIVAAIAISLALEGDDEGFEPRFLPSTRGDSAVVWAVGDGADGSSEAQQVAERIGSDKVDLLLYLGDVYDEGTAEEFEENYKPVYGRFDRITGPTPGNHDWPRHDEGYDPYWEEVRGKEPPPWYSFRVAGWEVLSLNSEILPDGEEADRRAAEAQLSWLRSELRDAGSCRLAFWHRPRYSVGNHDDQPDVQPLWDALQGRASLVVNGHEHNMQRYRPIAGITELVAGAGGHSHYELDRTEPRHAFANDSDYGALRLELRQRSASFEFIAADGRVLDSGRVSCRGLLPRTRLDPGG